MTTDVEKVVTDIIDVRKRLSDLEKELKGKIVLLYVKSKSIKREQFEKISAALAKTLGGVRLRL